MISVLRAVTLLITWQNRLAEITPDRFSDEVYAIIASDFIHYD